MSWEEDLFAYLDDLEGQAGALYAAERAPELADRSRAEYQSVTLATRLMAAVDHEVTLELAGVGAVSGRLARVGDRLVPAARRRPGAGWSGSMRSLPCRADRTAPSRSWPGRRSPGSAWAPPCAGSPTPPSRARCTSPTATATTARCVRVGADFVELATGEAGRLVLVALDHVAAVQSRG